MVPSIGLVHRYGSAINTLSYKFEFYLLSPKLWSNVTRNSYPHDKIANNKIAKLYMCSWQCTIAHVHHLTDSLKNVNYKEHVILGQPNLNVAWANRDSLFFILSPDS